ncbi:hypothetical protein BWQ96_01187 [Gracilariopsis chorda]|uniref:Uncharacterized protein n=1 Tax=Gracilariopsis chorda TaxID=448386 RepID=A0A2V3J3V2_9FLOR|nr:hypothetical protein BWQ96_01187 [Gracilariopsis chorda]|eukprot:PXF49049.1 hypothetical protein BWQ96_01187 [Gracilariopsis chorda]
MKHSENGEQEGMNCDLEHWIRLVEMSFERAVVIENSSSESDLMH